MTTTKSNPDTDKKWNGDVDITGAETHARVQCEDIRLIASSLRPLIVDKDRDTSTRFAFRVRVVVDGNHAYGYLDVRVNYFYDDADGDLQGYSLSFVLMGIFSAESTIKPEDFAGFMKMYTVSILYPYAREYASEQFRRAGNQEVVLPIINPQVVTKQIIENDLVEVEIIQPKSEE
ncbi:hypothetical protein D6779_05085 [Candidatus Parcubacteria bacterium]|nr:MAG: hypothetical protein D6779_05085 [Candidatus Parcubacteria bacterium]